MAAKRVSKSAIDWAKFAELIPKGELHQFRFFKAQTDTMISRIAVLPAELPAIDFSAYRSKLSDKAFVDSIESEYKKVAAKVPFPQNDAIKTNIKAKQADIVKEIEAFTAKSSKELEHNKQELNVIETVPDPYRMTRQMYVDYFPELRIPEEEPSYWPFREMDQPGAPGVEECRVQRVPYKDQV